MSTATITSKGQVTIPQDVRKALDLKQGDQLEFVVENGKAVIQPVRRRDFASLFGILKGRVPYQGRDAEREAARAEVVRQVLKRGESE